MIRPLDPGRPGELELVAERMRETLVEVLGEERGAVMYTTAWLRERVRMHLDAAVGAVWVAELDGAVVGHTIVRVETDDAGASFGLFSTTYVVPEARRRGLAQALLDEGEAWMRAMGLPVAATHTDEGNTPLIELYRRRGYRIVLRAPESGMIRLARSLETR